MNYFTRYRFLLGFVLLQGFSKSTHGSSSDTYIGCFEDFGVEATFPVDDEVFMSIFTILNCRKRCIITGFSFVGLWGGGRCYCATALKQDRVRLVDNSRCASPCPGDPTISCGDSDINSTLYSVHSVCPTGMFGENCSISCNCKDNRNCTVNGICPGYECADGWMLNETNSNREQCSVDVDECGTACNSSSTNCHNCGSDHQCRNTQGSFTCICKEGFTFSAKRNCEDVDECQTPCSSLKATKCYKCNKFNECQNTIGSYRCRCKPGFVFDVQQEKCEDVDECSQQLANCSHTCTNTNGSYICGCLEGFKIEEDSNHCVVVESGLWSLVVGLGLGNGVLSIVIVALAITVFRLLAKREFKTTTRGSCTENEVEQDLYMQMTEEARTAAVHPPDVYARLSNLQMADCATNENAKAVEHLHEIREDNYFEIV